MECERRGLLYRGSPNNVEVRLYMAAFRHHTHSANIQNCNQPQGKGSKYDDTVHFGAENHYSGGASLYVPGMTGKASHLTGTATMCELEDSRY